MTARSKVPFRDLRMTSEDQRRAMMSALERCLAHGVFIMGPEVEEFERRIAGFCGTQHCIGVSSGTSALYLALKAWGIGPGDEVICTPLSWIATLNAINACGAIPAFVDIADDLNIAADQISSAVTARTKAIVAVHFTGRLCDMPAIGEIANRHDLIVVEDAAQAFGAQLGTQRAGSFGDAGAFSLNPMKLFGGLGEAGAIVFDRPEAVEQLASLRYLGTVDGEYCVTPELNHKIDALQAAFLTEALPFLHDKIQRRQNFAQRYCDRLSALVQCPESPEVQGMRSVFFDFTVQTEARCRLSEHLRHQGIEVKVRHPVLMPDQPAYEAQERTELPCARESVERILSLPVHEDLCLAQVDYVCDSIESFFGRAGA